MSTGLVLNELDITLDTEQGLAKVLDAVSLTVARGQTFALVGESGCGKSMTALGVLRLLPEQAQVTRGTVELGGTELTRLPESQMRIWRGRRIGMVFQDPASSLNPLMRVGDQVAETITRHTSLRGEAVRARVLEWFAQVGLPEPERRIHDYPFQLSGGQKQRVMIAMALAAQPDVLVADEPTTALDVTLQKQILDLLQSLQKAHGMALLLITHDLGVVSQMADHVALMYAGQIVELASRDVFFAQPLHPYAQLLFDALPDQLHRGKKLAAIAGRVPAPTDPIVGCRFAARCPKVMTLCRSEAVPLFEPSSAHAVRCVLYREGTAVPVSLAAEEAVQPFESMVKQPNTVSVPLLEVRDYRVAFPIRTGLLRREVGAVQAVDGVSLTVAAGQTLALVGESGCGKTTLGKALLQLLRGVARIEGEASLCGERLERVRGAALLQMRRRMQVIFQDPYASLNPRMRVDELLEEGLVALCAHMDAAARMRRLTDLLDRVGLERNALERYPHEFSGGQRQRLAIARALAVEPKLIICDEPTSALDVSVQAQILNLLSELQQDTGIAYLFITHNFGVVEYLADTVAVMRQGKILESGPAHQILGAPQTDYTRTLLEAVPRLTDTRR